MFPRPIALLVLLVLIFGISARAAAEMKNWSDRRPIAAVFLAQSGTGWEKNPRGYFADSELDVRTEAGKAELRQRMMDLADRTIERAKEVGAQGVVVWDIEGGEMPHAVTYLGDPMILARVAPEMDAIADEFFDRFRQAGLRTGICIRPSTIVFRDEGDYPWIKGRYGHLDGGDPVGVLAKKISCAKERWGCTNFYIDTNYTPKRENGEMVRKKNGAPEFRLLTSEEIARLQEAHPDVLLWPEFQEPGYFATSSGYGEFHRVGEFSAKERVNNPNAFRVWMSRMVPEDLYQEWSVFIENGPAAGEIFLFETSPNVDGMGDILRNAASELALRRRQPAFEVAKNAPGRAAQLQESGDWAERRTVIDAMSHDRDPDTVRALADVLKGPSDGLPWFAARALARLSTPEALAVLQAAAASSGPHQAAAIRGLGASKNPDVTMLLVQCLQDSEPAIRWAALDALAERADPSSGPALRDFFESLQGTTAVTSIGKTIRALGRIGDAESVSLLHAVAKDPGLARHRRAIQEALTSLTAADPADLRE